MLKIDQLHTLHSSQTNPGPKTKGLLSLGLGFFIAVHSVMMLNDT